MATALVNGIGISAANISVIIPPIGPVVGITKLDYSKELQIDDNYGLGQEPAERAYGQYKYSGSISILKSAWNKIVDASPGKDPLKLPPFPITIIFTNPTTGFRKEVLNMVNFKANPMSVGAGDTKVTCDVPLAIGGIDIF